MLTRSSVHWTNKERFRFSHSLWKLEAKVRALFVKPGPDSTPVWRREAIINTLPYVLSLRQVQPHCSYG
jgi:hypothetical protein